MLRIFILADDLSGAADSGVACVAAGLRTSVALERDADSSDAEVLSLDADTRCMEESAAATEVGLQIRHYAANRDLLIFKKIDSTLRGNLARELVAALKAFRGERGERAIAIMAPAFPAIGRTTVNGIQFVYGQPLHELDIWRIQGMTGVASIPEMLRSADLKSALLPIEMIRSGRKALVEQMKTLAKGADVLVCDAETDADLRGIAEASMELDPQPIWVGSAGMAYQLPVAAGLAAGALSEPAIAPQCTGPLLFVIGSLSRNSIEQVSTLTASGQAVGIQMQPDVLLAGEGSARWSEFALQLESALKANRDVVISLAPEPQMDLAYRPRLADALGRMTKLVNGKVGALIASGGETARAVFQSWGITRLRLLGELERGVPVSVTENWRRELPVITKAGDFGQPDTLLKCAQFLRGAYIRSNPEHDIRKVIG